MKVKIFSFFKQHYYLLTGLLIFLSFPTYDIWFLKGFTFFAWISLVPLFVYIRGKDYKKIILSSFFSGIIGNYFVYNWIGHFGASVAGGYYVVVAFLIPYLTIVFFTKLFFAEYISRKFEKLRFLIYPSIWILFDWIQSIGFLAYPDTYWGYSQYPFTPFIQISSITGIMGITYILILTNFLISDLIYNIYNKKFSLPGILKTKSFKHIIILFIIFLCIILYGSFILIQKEVPEKKDFRVAMIQSCISPWENWKANRYQYLEYLEYYTKLALKSEPDIVIWSESATLENISFHYENGNLNPFEMAVIDIAKYSQTPLLTGEIGVIEDITNNRYYPQNSAVLISKDGEIVDTYAKIHLVPFGEWFPYNKWFPLIKKLLVKFGGSNFVPGDGPLLFNINGKKFGVLVCYEGIFYRLCREYKRMGSDFLVNITNDGWTDTFAGHMQFYAASKFRAIENGIWYVRAGNTGFTTLIDPYGRTIDSIPILKKGYLISDIDFSLNHQTFFTKYGDMFIYIIMIFLFCLSITSIFKIIKKR